MAAKQHGPLIGAGFGFEEPPKAGRSMTAATQLRGYGITYYCRSFDFVGFLVYVESGAAAADAPLLIQLIHLQELLLRRLHKTNMK